MAVKRSAPGQDPLATLISISEPRTGANVKKPAPHITVEAEKAAGGGAAKRAASAENEAGHTIVNVKLPTGLHARVKSRCALDKQTFSEFFACRAEEFLADE